MARSPSDPHHDAVWMGISEAGHGAWPGRIASDVAVGPGHHPLWLLLSAVILGGIALLLILLFTGQL